MSQRLNGKIAVLDLDDQNSMTYYHHVEEMEKVEYRFFKNFSGEYTNLQGLTENRVYSLFVRSIDQGVKTDVNRMGELLWAQGLYSGSKPGQGSGLRVISVKKLHDITSEVIRKGQALNYLYSIQKDSIGKL